MQDVSIKACVNNKKSQLTIAGITLVNIYFHPVCQQILIEFTGIRRRKIFDICVTTQFYMLLHEPYKITMTYKTSCNHCLSNTSETNSVSTTTHIHLINESCSHYIPQIGQTCTSPEPKLQHHIIPNFEWMIMSVKWKKLPNLVEIGHTGASHHVGEIYTFQILDFLNWFFFLFRQLAYRPRMQWISAVVQKTWFCVRMCLLSINLSRHP